MKGVIVAAGYGTRFLPVTKTVPKEMLPLLDRPSIDFVVEEFVASGIREILIISSRRKKTLEDYFDREAELEAVFGAESKVDRLAAIRPPDAEIFFVRQREMRGTGHALLRARSFIGNEPFVVAYPDDLHFGDPPLARQLVESWERTGCSVLATIHDPPNLNSYGVVAPAPDGIHVRDIVEKPSAGTEPSREASIGRYLYTPDIFDFLQEGWDRHTGGEYFHTYALQKLMERDRVVFHRTTGERMDIGTPDGFLRALLSYASRFPEYRKIIAEFADR